MSLFWQDDLSVGHTLIDAQHRELFAAFAHFIAACEQKRGQEQLEQLLGFLSGYVTQHFAEEERLMGNCAYAGTDAHRHQHRLFSERIATLQEELRQGGPTVRILVMTTKSLVYWLTEHIREVDRRLAEILQA